MKKFITFSIFFIFLNYLCMGQSGIELRVDGIILPNLLESQIPPTSIPGHLIFNANKNRVELFSQNFQWESLDGIKIVDDDKDSEVFFEETSTNDLLKIKLDNALKLTLSSNANGIPRLNFNGGLNVLIGSGAGRELKLQGLENIAIGVSALANNRTADNNIAIGTRALSSANIDDDLILFGQNNVAIGFEAGMTDTPNNSVFIGPYAGKNASNVNNALYIANSEGDEPLIYGEFGNKLVRINGSLQTDARSIFMRNLGGSDSDQGIKWGESSENPVFGITYDGTGSGGQNQLKIREYINTPSDIMSIKADGQIRLDKLTGSTTGLMIAQADGTLTRQDGMQWVMFSPSEIDPFFTGRYICIGHSSGPPTGCPKSVSIPIRLPHKSILKKVKIFYLDDDNVSYLNADVYSNEIINQASVLLGEFTSESPSSEIRSIIIDINDELIDNENLLYNIDLNNFGFEGNSLVYGISLGYVYE